MTDIALYSDRLIIKPLAEQHWPYFRALHLNPEVGRYVREVGSEAEVIAKFNCRTRSWRYESGDWLSLAIETLSGEFVGLTGLYCQDLLSQRAEVGYMLLPEQQGQGYATESLQAVIDWASLQFNVHKFVAHCACDNQASVRVLEKCGFQQEGHLRSHHKVGACWLDELVMGLLAAERES